MFPSPLRLTDPFGRYSIELERPANDTTYSGLLALLGRKIQPALPQSRDTNDLFGHRSTEITTYDARERVFPIDLPIAANNLAERIKIHYYQSFLSDLNPESIYLRKGKCLTDSAHLLCIFWQDRYYAVVLPIKPAQTQSKLSSAGQAISRMNPAAFSDPLQNGNWQIMAANDTVSVDLLNPGTLHDGDLLVLTIQGLSEDDLDVRIISEEPADANQPEKEYLYLMDEINIQAVNSIQVNGCSLEVVRGIIGQQAVDAIVNPVLPDSRSIGRLWFIDLMVSAVSDVREAFIKLGSLEIGECGLTPGFRLPARW